MPRHRPYRRRRDRSGRRRCDFRCTSWPDGRRGRVTLPDWLLRNLSVTLSAAAAVTTLGLAGCSHNGPRVVSSPSSTAHAPSSPLIVAAPPTTPLPAPEALIDVLNRLADPNVPAINKVNLVEGATPESADKLDKFTAALQDSGYLPMTFVANNVAWSDKHPSNVMATINVKTSQANNRKFTFPMEFTPCPPPQGGWMLSRQTAEMLLALGNSPPPTTPVPGPAPGPAPSQAPSPTPSG